MTIGVLLVGAVGIVCLIADFCLIKVFREVYISGKIAITILFICFINCILLSKKKADSSVTDHHTAKGTAGGDDLPTIITTAAVKSVYVRYHWLAFITNHKPY